MTSRDTAEVGERSGASSETDHERLVGSTSGHAIFVLTADGLIDSWPPPAGEMYGYDAVDVLGRHASVLLTDAEPATAEFDDTLADARLEPVEAETWHERADGSVFWGTTTVTPVYNDSFHGYTAVVRDTTVQKQYTRMLERQNDRLKEFTDILSHDLRNPLNVVDGRLELYRQTGDAEHLDAIAQTTDRMERLIDDLLRIARSGNVIERPEPTDVEPLVREAAEGTLPESATLTCEAVPTVMSERDRLRELFENLFRNAVQHGGVDVTIAVGPLEDGFFVADDGPGIPADDRPKVFDHGFTTDDDGSGFGLSLVRTIVGAHGWDVTVVEPESGGARFEITGVEFVS